MPYAVNGAYAGECFSLPCEVVDKHLNSAPPKAICILLYIFRNHLSTVQTQDISKALFLNETIVQQALVTGYKAVFLSAHLQPAVSNPVPSAKPQQCSHVMCRSQSPVHRRFCSLPQTIPICGFCWPMLPQL